LDSFFFGVCEKINITKVYGAFVTHNSCFVGPNSLFFSMNRKLYRVVYKIFIHLRKKGMIHKCPYTAVYVLIKENKEIHWNAELGNHAIIKAHVCVCEVGTALGGSGVLHRPVRS